MPDLPLPKPQPPKSSLAGEAVIPISVSSSSLSSSHVAATQPVAPLSSSVSQDKQPTETVLGGDFSSPTATPDPASGAIPAPMDSLQAPAVAPPLRPPAVVTALSSVSSHHIPSQTDSDDNDQIPVSAMRATTSMSPLPSAVPQKLTAPAEVVSEPNMSTPPSTFLPQSNSTGPTGQVAVPPSPSAVLSTQPTTQPAPTPLRPIVNNGISEAAFSTPIAHKSATPVTVSSSSTAAPLSSSLSPNLQSPPPTSVPPQNQATATAPPSSPVMAKPKKSKKGLIFVIIGIFIALLAIGGGAFVLLSKPSTQSAGTSPTSSDSGTSQGSGSTSGQNAVTTPAAVETTLEYWGLWEPSEVLDGVLSDFQKQNPTIAVRYVQQSYKDYRQRLQTAIASGNGPDLFRYHASWVPMLKSSLEPVPNNIMSPSEFAQTFYPVASKQLQSDGQLVGMPLEYDGLVLYYNQDILETAGIQPPKTWSELRDAARNLKIPKTGTPLQRAGLAIGTAENVDHFADIIAVLMLQNGADLQQPNTPEGRDALLFYTNFVTQDQVWSADMPPSTVAFARGDVAMMFAPSWRAFDITQQNPSLRFATVPLPQLPNTKVTWGTYWAEGVSNQSQNKDAAWKLLQYMSSKDVQQKLYTSQAQVRAFGEPYSRVDLADQLASNKVVGAILQDAPNALGWYMSTFTHDNGINDQIITYYKDAVNAMLRGGQSEQVLQTLQLGVNQVLSSYGVVAPMEPTPTTTSY